MSVYDLPQPIQDHIIHKVMGKPEKIYHDNRVYITEVVKCIRQAFFKRHLPRIPVDAEGCWNFYRGIIFDLDFGYAMKMHPQGRDQDRVTLPFFSKVHDFSISISGHLDFYYAADEDRIYELKTIANDFYIKKNGAKQAHIDQGMFYGYCYGTPRVSIIYVTMADVLVMPIDEQMKKTPVNTFLRRIMTRAENLVKANLNGGAPVGERVNWEGQWNCKAKYCPYRKLCYPNEMSKLEELSKVWKVLHPELYGDPVQTDCNISASSEDTVEEIEFEEEGDE